jgi:hypothetical protein
MQAWHTIHCSLATGSLGLDLGHLSLRPADTELQDCLRNIVDFMVQRNVGTKKENSFASLGLFISEVLTSFDRAGATERGKR